MTWFCPATTQATTVFGVFVVDAYGVVWFPGSATPKPKRLSPGTIDLDWQFLSDKMGMR